MVDNNAWVSHKKFLAASLLLVKLTSGNALEKSWNISEHHDVQEVLAWMIRDFQSSRTRSPRSDVAENETYASSQYMRDIFSHYCMGQENASFHGIADIQHELCTNLQRLIFRDEMVMDTKQREEGHGNIHDLESKISEKKVLRLFPQLLQYTDDLKQSEQVDPRLSQLSDARSKHAVHSAASNRLKSQ